MIALPWYHVSLAIVKYQPTEDNHVTNYFAGKDPFWSLVVNGSERVF